MTVHVPARVLCTDNAAMIASAARFGEQLALPAISAASTHTRRASAPALSGGRRPCHVYSRPDCHLCDEAIATLRRLQGELGFALREFDIDARRCAAARLLRADSGRRLDGEELFDFFVDEALVRERLESRR